MIGGAGLDGAGIREPRRNEFARVADVSAEQRPGREQVAIEEFPFGSDFNRLGFYRAEDLVDRRIGQLQAAVVG